MAVTVTKATQREFPGQPKAVGEARAWVLTCLPDGCPRADDVALVVSELATNTVLHTASGAPGGTFRVRLEVESGAVAVTVIDQGATLTPALRGPGEYGRGLDIVAALADAYDVTPTTTGRCAWCRLDLPTSEATR